MDDFAVLQTGVHCIIPHIVGKVIMHDAESLCMISSRGRYMLNNIPYCQT